jgi:hypothetical protein
MNKVLILAIAILGLAFIAKADDEAPALPDATPAAVSAIPEPPMPPPEATPSATPEGWQKPVLTGAVNISQVGFDNWVAGGENSLAWSAAVDVLAEYAGTINWKNTLKIKYGQVATDATGTRKSDDEIKWETVGTYNSGFAVNPYISFTIQTQMMPGYEYSPVKTEISRFMDPGYIKESAGAALSLANIVTFRLGAAYRETVAPGFGARYLGDASKKIDSEFGADAAVDYNTKLLENLLFSSVADLFSGFKAFDATKFKIDNTLTAKITENINVNFNFVIMYDRLLSKGIQMKETLNLGVTYNFL